MDDWQSTGTLKVREIAEVGSNRGPVSALQKKSNQKFQSPMQRIQRSDGCYSCILDAVQRSSVWVRPHSGIGLSRPTWKIVRASETASSFEESIGPVTWYEIVMPPQFVA